MEPSVAVANMLCNGTSVFLTGGAGVGKTYQTREILQILQSRHVRVVICGTTGISALNLPNGRTLHSTLRLPVGSYPTIEDFAMRTSRARYRQKQVVELVKQADILLIDEISMCSAWLLEIIDVKLRIFRGQSLPLGGMTLLAVGDFLQLPPVYNAKQKPTPHPRQELFAFQSPVWQALRIQSYVLHVSKRQTNPQFAGLLHQIRMGEILTPEEQVTLDARVNHAAPVPEALRIMVKRIDVTRINTRFFESLTTPTYTYRVPISIKSNQEDLIEDLVHDIKYNLYLEEKESSHKFRIGARVMLIVNNNATGYVNGDKGTVIAFAPYQAPASVSEEGWLLPSFESWDNTITDVHGRAKALYPIVKFDRTEQDMLVTPCTFKREIEIRGANDKYSKQSAEATALPLCLGWASTVHKVQGATLFGPVHIDCALMDWIPAAFYVALSRATELKHVTFINYKKTFQTHSLAVQYYTEPETLPEPDQKVLTEIERVTAGYPTRAVKRKQVYEIDPPPPYSEHEEIYQRIKEVYGVEAADQFLSYAKKKE